MVSYGLIGIHQGVVVWSMIVMNWEGFLLFLFLFLFLRLLAVMAMLVVSVVLVILVLLFFLIDMSVVCIRGGLVTAVMTVVVVVALDFF